MNIIKLNKYVGFVAFAAFLTAANAAYSAPAKLAPLQGEISKFIIVMLVIIAFMGILFVGLTVYNRIFVAKHLKDYKLNRYSLADSVDKDDAILNYVTKNKLR